jgi:nitroreductase
VATEAVPVGADAPVLEVMRTTRAMRRLKPDPVPRELLEQVVEAATWAPTGSNSQAYSFVIATDRDTIARLAPLWRTVFGWYSESVAKVTPEGMSEDEYARMWRAVEYQRDRFEEIPALIVPCYDFGQITRKVDPRDMARSIAGLGPRRAGLALRHAQRAGAMAEAASVYPGVQNLLLAARAHGLGATVTTWHLLLESEFKKVLRIPRRTKTFAIVPIGWPKGRFGPVRRRPAAEAIHWDRW